MPNRPTPRNLRLIREGPPSNPETRSEVPQAPPSAPSWLSIDAAVHWETIAAQMVAERMWRPIFERTLATYVELLAVFLRDPETFGATKLGQLRLFGGDLGLSPSHWHRVSRTSHR